MTDSKHERTVWTIGHSTHGIEQFRTLLKQYAITAIADVRSSPFSRHSPHFNRDPLRQALRLDGVAYSFLGNQLGGRPRSRLLYVDGIANYEAMAATVDFHAGLQRVIGGAAWYRIALMCSEHDPIDCHRCLLVGRALKERAFNVIHILANGKQNSHADIEQKLLLEAGMTRDQGDFFSSSSQRLAVAYKARARKVAFTIPQSSQKKEAAE